MAESTEKHNSIRIVHSLEALEDSADAWSNLLSDANGSIFQSYAWFYALYKHLTSAQEEVFCVFVHVGEKLVGVLPLIRESVSGRTLRAAVHDISNFYDFLYHKDDAAKASALAEIFVFLDEQIPAWELRCFCVPEESLVNTWKAAAEIYGGRLFSELNLKSPVLATAGDYGDFCKERSKKFLKNLRYSRRKLEKEGDLEFLVHSGGPDLDELLERGFDLENQGWKAEQDSSINNSPALRDFLFSIAHTFQQQDALRLHFLLHAGKPIAFDFSLYSMGTESLLKIGHDQEYNKLSPGALLRQLVLEKNFSAPENRRYEFLGTNDAWKMRWTDQCENLFGLRISKKSMLTELRHLGAQTKSALRKMVQKMKNGTKILMNSKP